MNVISQSCGNVTTTLVSCWDNIATTLEHYVNLWHCHNVSTTLKTTLNHNVHTTFRQCSMNVFWTLVPNIESHQPTTFGQCCHDVVATLKNYLCFNIVKTLRQCCPNVLWTLWAEESANVHTKLYQRGEITSFSMLSQHCYNAGGTHQESEIWLCILEIRFRMIKSIYFNCL